MSTQSPDAFLNDLVTLETDYAPASTAGTGENVDLYTGRLSFAATDASVPGNGALAVAVRRRWVGGGGGYGFGDWQLQVPVITGLVGGDFSLPNKTDPAPGWGHVDISGSEDFARCTYFGDLPTVIAKNPVGSFTPAAYWAGFHLEIPGAGSQLLLRRDAANTHAPSAAIAGYSSFPVVTKNDWLAACLPSLNAQNGQPGEGFLVLAPDGRRYWFDWLTYAEGPWLSKPYEDAIAVAEPQVPHGPALLPRLRVRLYASRVEDRFGHWVTYTYGGPNNDELTDIKAGTAQSTQVQRHLHISWAMAISIASRHSRSRPTHAPGTTTTTSTSRPCPG